MQDGVQWTEYRLPFNAMAGDQGAWDLMVKAMREKAGERWRVMTPIECGKDVFGLFVRAAWEERVGR